VLAIQGEEPLPNAFQDPEPPLVGRRQRLLGAALLGDVMEHEHGADHPAGGVEDRRGTILNRNLAAVAGDQRGVVRQGYRAAFPQHMGHRVVTRLAGLFVDRAEHALDRLAQDFLRGPAGERLGHRIEEGNPAFGIAGDHGVADAGERDAEPLTLLAHLAVGLVLVERHLDAGPQLALLERLDDVPKRLGQLCAVERGGVRVGGQEHHRQIALAADRLGGGDAVHGAGQAEIHQHQVRRLLADQRDGLFAAGH
jgi:hypothetical protein